MVSVFVHSPIRPSSSSCRAPRTGAWHSVRRWPVRGGPWRRPAGRTRHPDWRRSDIPRRGRDRHWTARCRAAPIRCADAWCR
jgi:hypothetical protein